MFQKLLITFLLFFTLSFAWALNKYEKSPLLKDNIKQYNTLKAPFGRMDEKSGIIQYHYDLQVKGYSGSAEHIARAYLIDNAAKYGIDPKGETLLTRAVKQTRGGAHVYFEQALNDLPVYGARIAVTINPNNEITFVASSYRPRVKALHIAPKIDEQQAIQIAREYLNVTGRLIGTQRSKLMLFESKDRGSELCWRIEIPTEQPLGDWEVMVNAVDGRITNVRDLAMTYDGSGMIWNPDPLTTAGVDYGGNYKDNNDNDSNYLNDERISVVLKDITYEGGLYKLKGPYAVLADRESPTDNFPELTDPDGFNYTRNQQEFEDVMAYYHIDLSTRHLILDLGYDDSAQHEFQVDPHGLNGDDNSHYISGDNYLALGEGGVDDAEDADVLWHEHAHSFQTNLTGGMSYSGETMAIQEGSSDYWAASYSRSINTYHWGYVFNWDGHNEFWNGRRCDTDMKYPDDYSSWDGHGSGQIWSSALMDIWADLGRSLSDELFIETHYIWGYSPSMQDAAQSYIQADRNLYDGQHLSVIVRYFDDHGLANWDDYMATIVHTPLSDTDDYQNPYPVVATITPGPQPLDQNRLWVIWGIGSPSDTLNMTPTGNTDEYSADIPASGDDIDIVYYIAAVDQADQVTYDPPNPPDTLFTFHVGADAEAPVIVHTALEDQVKQFWPASVTATVTDNYGVDTVICYYSVNNHALDQSFAMVNTGGDTYSGSFPFSAQDNDSVFYRIQATDISNNHNQTNSPASGYYAFRVLRGKGLIEGHVDMTDRPDDSGVAVYLSGSLSDTTYTDASGYYSFAELDTGTYAIEPYMNLYKSTPSSVDNIVLDQDTTSGIDFVLDPEPSGIEQGSALPKEFALSPNFPNPFNPSTTIRYQLPRQASVRLIIYNARGQIVRTLVSKEQSANYYSVTWNGRNDKGMKVSSGIYIYYFKAGNFETVRKMILVK